tara:strand:+ start:4100 stop:4327 length:228 start_codon:yes stop_codon:yes gene_type:complete
MIQENIDITKKKVKGGKIVDIIVVPGNFQGIKFVFQDDFERMGSIEISINAVFQFLEGSAVMSPSLNISVEEMAK